MTTKHRPLLIALLAMWVGTVAYLTLTPAGHTPPLTLRHFLCLGCGELHGSDMLRNWVLFVPGGLLVALALETRRSLALAIAFTCCIEFVQIGVPGRDPALQDLLLNTLGAASGTLVARRGIGPRGRHVLRWAAVLAWLAPLILLLPRTTPYDLWGQWTPRFGSTASYEGRILDARVGGLLVESRRFTDKAALDAAIVDREPIVLSMSVGPEPDSWAPLFQIFDGERQGVLELGALGPDLVLRGRNPARVLRLDQPDVRWPDAMTGLAPGDSVTLVVERGRGSVCMAIDDRERCNLAPSLGDGWGHVLNLEGPALWFRELVSIAWALGLGALVGLTSPTRRSALVFGAGLALLGYLGGVLSPDVAPSVFHAAVLVLGAGTGITMRAPIVRLWKEVRPD